MQGRRGSTMDHIGPSKPWYVPRLFSKCSQGHWKGERMGVTDLTYVIKKSLGLLVENGL